METFAYGCLGALIPEIYRSLGVRGQLVRRELPPTTGIILSLAITISWIIAAGFFATALPGSVSQMTAVYAGLSLPATIQRFRPRDSIEIDTIELEQRANFTHVFWRVFYA